MQKDKFGGSGWIRTIVGVRQQIYSLPPLATRARYHKIINEQTDKKQAQSWRWDLNPQPVDYKSTALPVELRQHTATNPKKSRPQVKNILCNCQEPERLKVLILRTKEGRKRRASPLFSPP